MNEVRIQITADQSGVQSGMSQAASAVKDGLGNMQNTFAEAQSAISGSTTAIMSKLAQLAPAAIAAATAFAAFEVAKSSIQAFTSYAANIEHISETLGMSAQAASGLAATLQVLGMSSDTYISIVMRMERQLKQHEDRFKTLGVAVRDVSTGAFLPQQQILENVVDKMREYKAGADQMQFAMEMLGPRGAQAAFELMHMGEATAIALPMMQQLGLEMSGPDTEGARQFAMQGRALGMVWDAVKVKIGQELIPQLGGLMAALMQVAGPVIGFVILATKNVIATFMRFGEVAKIIGDIIYGVFGSVSRVIEGVANAVVKIVQLDFVGAGKAIQTGMSNAAQVVKDAGADMVKTATDTERAIQGIFAGTKMPTTSKPTSGTKPYTSPDEKTEKSRMPAWRDELDQRKIAENAFFDMSITEEKAFWEKKLALCASGSQDWLAVRKQIFELDKKAAKDAVDADINALKQDQASQKASREQRLADQDAIITRIKGTYGVDSNNYRGALLEKQKMLSDYEVFENEQAQKRIENEEKVALMAIASKEKEVQTRQSLGEISAAQEAAMLKTLAAQRLAIETQSLSQIETIWKQYPKQYQAALDQMKVAQQKHANDIAKINDDAAKKQQQQWKEIANEVASPVESAFKTLGDGLLGIGTKAQTMQQIMVRGLQQLVQGFAQLIEKIILAIAKQEIFNALKLGSAGATGIAGMVTQALGMTGGGAGAAGAAALTTAGATLNTAGVSLDAAGVTLDTAAVGLDTAGVSLNAAAVALTTAAALEDVSNVGALAFERGGNVPSARRGWDIPSAAGGWNIPRGAIPSLLHPNEMVLPSDLADNVRNMSGASGGSTSPSGGQTVHNHYNIQAWDSKDVKSFLKKHANAVHDSLRGPVRNFRPQPGRV